MDAKPMDATNDLVSRLLHALTFDEAETAIWAGALHDEAAAEITALRAERDALAARLEALELRPSWRADTAVTAALRDATAAQANISDALRARVAGLEGALTVTDEMVERAVKAFAGVYLGSLGEDMRVALTAALSPSAQEARDAE